LFFVCLIFIPFFRSAQEMKKIRKKLAVEKKRELHSSSANTVMGIPFFHSLTDNASHLLVASLSSSLEHVPLCSRPGLIGKIAERGSACREKRHRGDFPRPAMELRQCAAS
jgi:hypothetical protein